jgi:DNA-binding response OmpR family regulator
MRILVIEDDPRVARLVSRALIEAGHQVELAEDGLDGLQRAETGMFDVIVLDVMLPKLDGLSVSRQLRRQRVRTPILMLTARDAVADRVQGLDAGADDYLVKPFALEELLARIRALGRRLADHADAETLIVGDLVIDLDRHEVRRGDRIVELTPREFELLVYLARHQQRVLTKEQILEHIWGYDSSVTTNVVETYIHYLREKIDRGSTRPLIRTIRGVGYSLRP